MAREKRGKARKSEAVWGAAPCPLVPAVLRRERGELKAPASICKAADADLSLAQLGASFWKRCESLSKTCRSDLLKMISPLLSEHRDLALGSKTDLRDIDIDSLGLDARITTALRAGWGERPLDPSELTLGELLDMPRIGPKRALTIAGAIDVASAAEARRGAQRVSPKPEHTSQHRVVAVSEAETARLPQLLVRRTDPNAPMPSEVSTFFRVFAAWAGGELGHETLADALPAPGEDWPPELVQLWIRLGDCSTEQLAGGIRNRYHVPGLIERAFAECDHRHRFLMQARIFSTTRPTSLDSLARVLGESVEVMRDAEQEALRRLEVFQTVTYKPVMRRALEVRSRLGVAIPSDVPKIRAALDWAVECFEDPAKRDFERDLFLWLAGPYRADSGWLVGRPGIADTSRIELINRKNEKGLIETAAVTLTLSELDILPEYHDAWIDRLGEFIGLPGGLMTAQDRMAENWSSVTLNS